MSDSMEPPTTERVDLLGRWPAQIQAAFWVFLAIIAVRLIILPFVIVHQWSLGETGIVADVVVVALYALCVLAAVRLRRGAGWARIVLTVLGAVSIVTAAFALLSATGLAIGAAGIAGIVLLWLPASNAWFRAGKASMLAEARDRAAAASRESSRTEI